jgi:hypothetical protein
MPSLELLRAVLGRVEVRTVVVLADCAGGFLGAYWRRPDAYVDAAVRAGISTFSTVRSVDERMAILREDLRTGRWARRWRHLMDEDAVDLGYRIVIVRLRGVHAAARHKPRLGRMAPNGATLVAFGQLTKS